MIAKKYILITVFCANDTTAFAGYLPNIRIEPSGTIGENTVSIALRLNLCYHNINALKEDPLMKKISVIIAAALLCSVLLSGCAALSGATPGPTVTASPYLDPSLLISKQEAESLVGNALEDALVQPTTPPTESMEPITQPAPTGTGTAAPSAGPTQTPSYSNFMMCYYDSAVKGGRFLQISVMQVTPQMAAQSGQAGLGDLSALGQFNAMKGKGPSTTGDPTMMIVSSIIGEKFETVDAFILPPGIHLYYRGYYIVIGVGDPSDAANEQILEKAGQLAVHNLDRILDSAPSTPQASPSGAAQPSPTASAK